MGSRIVYIDTAKALAMLFVILGHCDWIGAIPRLYGMIYSFHMPVFFIMSGYFVRRLHVGQAVCKYAKAYLRPYILLSLFVCLVAVAHASYAGLDIKGAFCQSILRVIWVSAGDKSNFLFDLIPDIGPSWFLPALFMACVLYSSFIMRFGFIEQLLLCLLLACYAVSSIPRIQLPFGAQYGMVALLYMYLGNHLVEFRVLDKIHALSSKFKFLSIGLCMLLIFIKGGGVSICR